MRGKRGEPRLPLGVVERGGGGVSMTAKRGGRDLFPEAGKALDAAVESFSRARERPGGAERGGSSPAKGGSPGLGVVEGGGAGGTRSGAAVREGV